MPLNDPRWPVSIKGVVLHAGSVLLAYNERDEWELPGGRLEEGETPEACVEREILEETGVTVRAGRLLDSMSYQVLPGKTVVVVAYQCEPTDPGQAPVASPEHVEVAYVPLDELDTVNVPDPYRAVIQVAASMATDSFVLLVRPGELYDRAPYAYAAVLDRPSRLVFTAGACPLDEHGAVVAEGDVTGQAEKVMANLRIALAAAGAQLTDVVKTTVYVASTRREDLDAAWEVVHRHFGDHEPPSTLLGVTVLGYEAQLVEVEAVAILQ